MNFKENGFAILRNVLSGEMCDFFSEYMCNKSQVVKTMRDYEFIKKYNAEYGYFEDEQVPNTFSIYGDITTDMLLVKMKSLLEQQTGLKLQEQYSYLRVYKKGDDLKKHKDRPQCEISTTLNLGGDKIWPIFLESNVVNKVELAAGDLLIYRGCDFSHWREPFEGDTCIQTFLHYSDVNGSIYDGKKFDHRPHLGLPAWFKGR